jgi:hypothetical protein
LGHSAYCQYLHQRCDRTAISEGGKTRQILAPNSADNDVTKLAFEDNAKTVPNTIG